ncbi:Protein of unknown function [Bacillus mycoides]|nr:Protein of unknown function [Bacillus mycoides]
MVKPWWRAMD